MAPELSTETQVALIKHDISTIKDNMEFMRSDFTSKIEKMSHDLHDRVGDVNTKVTDVNASINVLRSYLFKALFGIASIIAVYFIEWVLSGGLRGVVQSARAAVGTI